jgi:tetratricopeptide (TPR) repeat protein
LGQTYHDLGDYRKAISYFRTNIERLGEELLRQHFGIVDFPAIHSRVWLVWSLAEVGAFSEGKEIGETAVELAEASGHLGSLIVAYLGVGHLYLRQADLQHAVAVLERGLTLCQSITRPLGTVTFAIRLGLAQVQAGQLTAGLALLEETVEQTAEQSERSFQAACLGEAYLRAGNIDQALRWGRQALEFSCLHQQRGAQAWALRLLGDITAAQEPLESGRAEDDYRQALALAEELGMRPLQAHCHRGLGMLYARKGQLHPARVTLSSAMDLYHALDMTLDKAQVEVVLAQITCDPRILSPRCVSL